MSETLKMKHLKIDEALHRELTKLKGELGKKTYNEVIWILFTEYEKILRAACKR